VEELNHPKVQNESRPVKSRYTTQMKPSNSGMQHRFFLPVEKKTCAPADKCDLLGNSEILEIAHREETTTNQTTTTTATWPHSPTG
jgi:hypothetical protein